MRRLGLIIGLLLSTASAQAAPPALPLSVWGTAVDIKSNPVAAGTLVTATCNTYSRSAATTMAPLDGTMQAVYSLDIDGADAEEGRPGCGDGEIVTFAIGGASAHERAYWRSGKSIRIDLHPGAPTSIRLSSFQIRSTFWGSLWAWTH